MHRAFPSEVPFRPGWHVSVCTGSKEDDGKFVQLYVTRTKLQLM